MLYAINALSCCTVQQGGHMNKNPRGFSLIELLIVVAVILVIAAIAIPNLMRSRAAANQASAVGSLHVMNTAEATYSSTYGGYTPTLGYLGPPSTGTAPAPSGAELIDSILSGGSPGATESTKSGYTFTYSAGVADASGRIYAYTIAADPITPGSTGYNHYYTDQTGVIRQNTTAVAGSTDSPLAG
jgi:prepilin-type N-terminal cleavage/methylation domain-containing protein